MRTFSIERRKVVFVAVTLHAVSRMSSISAEIQKPTAWKEIQFLNNTIVPEKEISQILIRLQWSCFENISATGVVKVPWFFKRNRICRNGGSNCNEVLSISCILNITKVEFHFKKIFVILSFYVAFRRGK